jgi:crotonobetainyl-CoA:carnitine CoA-transferase CaiB-like acyl-CoA transferase
MRPPLEGVRIVEFEGIGPGPLAGRMLADMGAEVANPLRRGKKVLLLDLKNADAAAEAMALVASADALIEGNRPGVMERLGLGPAECAARNPKLVYGRMTGWGQSGPLSQAAGHDLNYVALTGLLSLSAHRGERPSPFHDAPFYDVYTCADGRHITVGAMEPQFYALLLDKLDLTDVDPAQQYDTATWPALKERFTALFATRTRDEWSALLEGTDVCFAPVLDLNEAARHPHLRTRGTLALTQGGVIATPAPRFSMP